jgi:hypothetical protein
MAKSASVFLLGVLAVAVSLQAAHRVDAARDFALRGGTGRVHLPPDEQKKLIEAHKAWTEKLVEAELDKKINDLSDVIEPFLNQYAAEKARDSAALPEGFYYFKVTGIMVGTQMLEMGSTLDFNPKNGNGAAILSKKMFPFLNKEACGVLESEFPAPKPAKFRMLCNEDGSADQLLPVTLLFAGGYRFEYNWQKHSDGLMCLPILALP